MRTVFTESNITQWVKKKKKRISYPAKYASSFTNHLIHSDAFRSFSWDEMSEGHAISIQRPVLTNLTPAADGGG